VAAGSGQRLGAGRAKALVELGGRPLFAWAVDAARAASSIGAIVVAAPPGDEDGFATDGVSVVSGGASRSESVAAALGAVSDENVVIHDAARPFAEPVLFDRVVTALESDTGLAAAVVAVAVPDTIKRSGPNGEVAETLDRSALRAIQTPQAFRREALAAALDAAPHVLASATDDASLVEIAGGRVALVEGSVRNMKITTPEDLVMAEALLG